MNHCLVTNEGLRANLENERLINHCHDLLLKDFYIYRATDKLLDVFENEISFYEHPHLELSNATLVYELLTGNFSEDKEIDYLKLVYEDSVNDLAIHLSKSFRHGSSIENATRILIKILISALKVEDEEEKHRFYITQFNNKFSEINLINFKDIEKRISHKEATCL